MLLDAELFSNEEVLKLLEDPKELKDNVIEALEMIQE